eukprot:4039322-Pleurochrysis_carterae.AAC.1
MAPHCVLDLHFWAPSLGVDFARPAQSVLALRRLFAPPCLAACAQVAPSDGESADAPQKVRLTRGFQIRHLTYTSSLGRVAFGRLAETFDRDYSYLDHELRTCSAKFALVFSRVFGNPCLALTDFLLFVCRLPNYVLLQVKRLVRRVLLKLKAVPSTVFVTTVMDHTSFSLTILMTTLAARARTRHGQYQLISKTSGCCHACNIE